MQTRYKIGKRVEHGKGKGLVNKLWIRKGITIFQKGLSPASGLLKYFSFGVE